MNLTKQEKRKNFLALLFFVATVTLWIWGLFTQFLLVLMRQHPDFLTYLLSLILSAVILLLFYIAVIWYPDGKDWFRIFSNILLLAAFVWSLYMLWTTVNIQLGNLQAEAPFDKIFAPDARKPYRSHWEDCRFHTIKTLFGHYGPWIRTTYTLIITIWCSITVLVSFQVYRWWEKCSYFFCFFLILLHLLLPLWEAYDKISCKISYPFSANWILNCAFVAPALGIMFGLIKISRPRGPLLMVPGDDFWREIVD